MQATVRAVMPSTAAFHRRPSTKNAAGGRDNTTAAVSGMGAVPCHVHPDTQRASGETEQRGALQGDERFRIMFPVGTDARKTDHVVVDGVRYELVQIDTSRSWALEVEALAVRTS